ncbi:hypothetical protein [Natronomonas amylolytica]|uniref:hypothetical protein n=1 Tax=Natronomonas amylolytica TaxID=3108498 RepID=UPI00300A6989
MDYTIEARGFRSFVLVYVLFSLASLAVLWALDSVSLRTYFVVAFIGLLVTSEIFPPADPKTVWWKRLQWVKAGGWVVLLYILVERVLMVVQ